MKKKFIFCGIILIFSSLTASPVNNNPWEYSRTISDVKIFQRPGSADGIFEFLAITTLNVPRPDLQKIIMDIPNNRYWMADCVHSEFIIKTAGGEIIAYYITAPPWPVSRRDSVIKINYETVSGRTIFKMNSLPKGEAERYRAVNPGNVRIYNMDGEVMLNEINSRQTEVRFSAAGESGGNVPHFIVRMGGWVIPFKTLTGLRRYSLP